MWTLERHGSLTPSPADKEASGAVGPSPQLSHGRNRAPASEMFICLQGLVLR
jgi:hypothetical protein